MKGRSRYEIKLTANSCIELCSSINAVSFSSARTAKRFPLAAMRVSNPERSPFGVDG